MLGLPKSTEFNKRIPKQKFYDNLTVTPALKKVFIDQIKTIYWRNKIAASTTNLALGTTVTELEVFEVKLNSQLLDDSFLRQIDKEIPYHILFILEYEGKYKAVIGYKEESGGNAAFKVNRYYSTEWMDEDALPLKLEGLSVDSVYENFIRQIAGDALAASASGETLKESVDRDEKRQALVAQIAKLQKKIKSEKQLNKQMELNTQLKKLKKELEVLS
ncbi:DUF4391 domain-containing protein [uncultured Phascolarctobacterium sp.]|uniref:DUF4391 domain-containing protein n=1 Tax=uncultured Phascolarctobacterium sp. TaxID=512296 RepID=UPI0025E904E4|nr:DUF4391 domain-containing protein [uncultured Phascolarctobacterium sp.]